jgi:hypothetical protein
VPSASVKRIALERLVDLERRIAEMTAMKQTLQQLASCCLGDERPDGPVLDDLGQLTQQVVLETYRTAGSRAP